MNLDKEIAKREHAIQMYGFDVWGSSAGSNVDRTKELRKEIENLKKYGKPNPKWWQKW